VSEERISALVAFARSLGVSDVRVIAVDRIVLDDRFRDLCEEPRCPNFGTSIHCPPHSMTPAQFRHQIKAFARVLAFKFDMPHEAVMGPERREAGLLMHEVTASIEYKAKALGFERACGYSGGGCKVTLCYEHDSCAALEDPGTCRHSDKARPSLSGMGVNWHELSKTLAWLPQNHNALSLDANPDTVMMAGLVFLE
jgi:predicted metal-binding protein